MKAAAAEITGARIDLQKDLPSLVTLNLASLVEATVSPLVGVNQAFSLTLKVKSNHKNSGDHPAKDTTKLNGSQSWHFSPL